MFTSLLKTFLLSLPMSMGGLCNSGNSYVHNAYDRRNVATIKNDIEDRDYDTTIAMNNSYYVFHSKDINKMMDNLPSYINFEEYSFVDSTRYTSYTYFFEFFTNYPYKTYLNVHFYGLCIYRNLNVIEFRGFLNKYYSFESQDDYELIYSYDLNTRTYTKYYRFDSIYVQNANINNNGRLDYDTYHEHTYYHSWEVFNYFFYRGLKSFTFVNDINYNAPYGSDRNSIYITDADFSSSNPGSTILKTIIDAPFISNGTLYQNMRFRYFNGYATKYKDSSGNIQTSNFGASGYFGYFEYLQADEDSPNEYLFDIALYRINNEHLTSNSMSWYISDNTQWNNESYRYVQFMNDVNDSDLYMVAKVNKAGGTFDDSFTDVGLGNAFNLMSTAFLGFSSLFGIAIIPGLSIGLLLFLPLIMSIVVLVFKAVKK